MTPTWPGENTLPGMMPTRASPGVMRPGQLGPMTVMGEPRRKRRTRTMSIVGTPSVMQTMSGTSAYAASSTASAAKAAGTKMRAQLAPVAATPSATVSKTGTPSAVSPPRPGVTPATTFVPYSMQRRVWKDPSLPVMPWTRRRVWLPTRIDIGSPPHAIPSRRARLAGTSWPAWREVWAPTRSMNSMAGTVSPAARRTGRDTSGGWKRVSTFSVA